MEDKDSKSGSVAWRPTLYRLPALLLGGSVESNNNRRVVTGIETYNSIRRKKETQRDRDAPAKQPYQAEKTLCTASRERGVPQGLMALRIRGISMSSSRSVR